MAKRIVPAETIGPEIMWSTGVMHYLLGRGRSSGFLVCVGSPPVLDLFVPRVPVK